MNNQTSSWLNMRESGVLLHISSLPGDFGIGNLGSSAHEFVDFLSSSGFSCWQICPTGPTGFGDSPYQSFSSFAGNPYFIDLNELVKEGLLQDDEIQPLLGLDESNIDYGGLWEHFWPVLEKAADRFDVKQHFLNVPVLWDSFLETNKSWLENYCLFMALKVANEGVSWSDWPEEHRNFESVINAALDEEIVRELERHQFYQFVYLNQWVQLKKYANDNGISIIGDVPIFVAHDSADVWSNRKVFQIKNDGQLIVSAGVPPDYFSEKGQYWGNPLYDWEYLHNDDYQWWIERLGGAFERFDIIRLDHFRAFATYWEIPGGAPDATTGRWVEGPGETFFNKMFETFGEPKIIAEDLGYIDQATHDLREQFQLPGMKILQFGFGHDAKNVNLPHFYPVNSVVYSGTHDNDTTVGWMKHLDGDIRRDICDYFAVNLEKDPDPWPMIRAAFFSVSALAVFTMQDFLELGSDARMNTPGTAQGNWQWRVKRDELNQFISQHKRYLQRLHFLSGRTGNDAQRLYSASPE